MKLKDEQKKEFIELALPLIEFAENNLHPYEDIVINVDGVKLKEDQLSIPTVCARRKNVNEKTFDFGTAIQLVKQGKKITRKGWNGKEQYVMLVKDIYGTNPYGDHGIIIHEDIGSQALVFCGTRGQQVGWLASQSDMLAEDWMEA